MKKLKSKIAAKLNSHAGESIAEVLIALLIAALAMTMLAATINSTAKIINQSKKMMKAYYDKSDQLASRSGTIKTGEVNVTIKDETNQPIDYLVGKNKVNINYTENDKVSQARVISYWIAVPTPSGGEGG